ncbi:MAG: mRNA interferase RelE/StbE [Verrucomicrobiales bacterium]|jgi:mRNA interferase RelE/StbE
MHRVEFHRNAEKALKRLPTDRRRQILEAVRELANTPDPTTHRQVKAMIGNWKGQYRLRVGEYRVIFKLIGDDETSLLIYVTNVGPRGGIY